MFLNIIYNFKYDKSFRKNILIVIIILVSALLLVLIIFSRGATNNETEGTSNLELLKYPKSQVNGFDNINNLEKITEEKLLYPFNLLKSDDNLYYEFNETTKNQRYINFNNKNIPINRIDRIKDMSLDSKNKNLIINTEPNSFRIDSTTNIIFSYPDIIEYISYNNGFYYFIENDIENDNYVINQSNNVFLNQEKEEIESFKTEFKGSLKLYNNDNDNYVINQSAMFFPNSVELIKLNTEENSSIKIENLESFYHESEYIFYKKEAEENYNLINLKNGLEITEINLNSILSENNISGRPQADLCDIENTTLICPVNLYLGLISDNSIPDGVIKIDLTNNNIEVIKPNFFVGIAKTYLINDEIYLVLKDNQALYKYKI